MDTLPVLTYGRTYYVADGLQDDQALLAAMRDQVSTDAERHGLMIIDPATGELAENMTPELGDFRWLYVVRVRGVRPCSSDSRPG